MLSGVCKFLWIFLGVASKLDYFWVILGIFFGLRYIMGIFFGGYVSILNNFRGMPCSG